MRMTRRRVLMLAAVVAALLLAVDVPALFALHSLHRLWGWLEALCSRTFEPDKPNWTPRVSGLIQPCGSHLLSILRAQEGNPDCCERFFYTYDAATPGVGHFISTYKHNGNPIPSFEGEPLRFACPRTIGDFAQGLWSSLNPDNKVLSLIHI